MGNYLYVGRCGLPIDAAGIRVTNIGGLLRQLGHNVHYVCIKRVDNRINESEYNQAYANGTYYMSKKEVHYSHNNSIYSYLPKVTKKADVIKDVIDIVSARSSFKRIKKYCEKESIDGIILYNDAYSLTKKLISYCKANEIKLIADVSEWYEINKSDLIANQIIAWLTDRRIKKLDNALDGIIAISPFFYDYYKKLNKKTVWIPPIINIDCFKMFNNQEQLNQNDDYSRPLKFVYAGSPATKDILVPFVKAVMTVNNDEQRVQFDIIGIDDNYLKKRIPNYSDTIKGIVTHGRLSHEKTISLVEKATFGVLFRDNLKYAKAGFSTKFAECMSLGVPMICNEIGGADAIIDNGINGIKVENYNLETLVEVIEMVLSLDYKTILNLKNNAYKTAVKLFSGDNYIDAIKQIL